MNSLVWSCWVRIASVLLSVVSMFIRDISLSTLFVVSLSGYGIS